MTILIGDKKVLFEFDSDRERETLGSLLMVSSGRVRSESLRSEFMDIALRLVCQGFEQRARKIIEGNDHSVHKDLEKQVRITLWNRIDKIVKDCIRVKDKE